MFTLALVILSMFMALGQESDVGAGDFLGLGIAYGATVPAGDLADRFGSGFAASLGAHYFVSSIKSNFGLEASFLFGGSVKEDVLEPYRLSNGAILGNNGSLASIFLRQRGLTLFLTFEKIIIGLSGNERSGLSAGIGAGVMQHNIRIQVDSQNAPQFTGNYAKGYDRNTTGPAVKQSIGYTHLAKRNNFNYRIQLSVIEAFTQNRRLINFDTQQKETGTRLDLMAEVRFTYFLPVIDRRPAEEIFY